MHFIDIKQKLVAIQAALGDSQIIALAFIAILCVLVFVDTVRTDAATPKVQLEKNPKLR